MQTLQHTLPVPAGTKRSAIITFRTNGLVGNLTLGFINESKSGINNQPVATEPLSFGIMESENGVEFNEVSIGGAIVAPGGGEATRTIRITKAYFQIVGKGVNGKGGYARLHMAYEGRQNLGQIDVVTLGKAGYGFDGGAGLGQNTASPGGYPEGTANYNVDEDPSSSSSSSSSSGSSGSSNSSSSSS